MAYTINLTNGTIFATIPDGTVNTSSSMTLVGKNYAGYGAFLDENFIHLLENASNATAPGSPLIGQLWWDSGNTRLNIYTGSGGWKPFAANTSATSAPSNNTTGDLWFDTTNQQLKVWTGASFLVVGPAYSSATGTAGAIPETINDNGATPHYVTSIYVYNTRVAIFSKDATFIPASPIPANGFPYIYPGVTLNNTLSAIFAGTASNADLLDSLDSTSFMRTDTNTSTTGTVRVLNNTGMYVGTANAVNVSATATDGNVSGTISGGNVNLRVNVGGTNYLVAQALGSNGTFAIANSATVGGALTVTGNFSAGNISTAGTLSVGGNITTSGTIVGNVVPPPGGAISTTGNITGNNVIATNTISAGSTISASGNITGSYLFGNGSQLTGLSAAISVSQIENGTSNAKIGASGGNLAISIGGTANVVVFDTTTTYANIVSVRSIAKTGTNAVGNIGSSTNYFNQVFATATTALYADVAERFHADEVLEPGTVVELGGVAEITRSRSELSENVFGVISTKPAYTMNGGAGDDDTHPKVAMTGRVPVKVVGVINKGDRLVSAGQGLARAALVGEATAFNTIGRALEGKSDSGVGTIEAIVTIK